MNQNINSLRKDLLVMKIRVGEKDIDFTYDNLFISEESKATCKKSETEKPRKISQRPFIDRYRKYSSNWLNDMCYEDVVHFFFDENVFFNESNFFEGAVDTDSNNDRIVNENIYMTLFYLFPTGFPSIMNIRFSSDIISNKHSYTPFASGYFPYDIGKKEVTPDQDEKKKKIREDYGAVITTVGSIFGDLFDYPYTRFSYLGSKSQCDYTIAQVTWKNDIYNHPQYVDFLGKVYSLCIWQRTTGKTEIDRIMKDLKSRFKKLMTAVSETKPKMRDNGTLVKANFNDHSVLVKLKGLVDDTNLSNEDFERKLMETYMEGKVKSDIEAWFRDLGLTNARDSSVQSTRDNFIETYIQYAVFIVLDKAIHETKMLKIDEFLTDKDFMKAMKDQEGKLLKPFYELRESYFKFTNEVGESTNDSLNKMIIDFMVGESNELGYCSIYYHNVLLKNRNKTIKDIRNIIETVDKINRTTKIRTGINKDVSTLTNINVMGSTSPFSSSSIKPRTEFVIYLSMNVYDQQLDNVNMELLRCYLLRLELGRRLNNLVYNDIANQQNNVLVISEIKSIPKMTKKEVSQMAKELGEETPKITAPITVRGGKLNGKKMRNKRTRRRKPITKNHQIIPIWYWPV